MSLHVGPRGDATYEGRRLEGKLGAASHLWVCEALTSLDLNRDENGAEGEVIIAGSVSVLLLGGHTRYPAGRRKREREVREGDGGLWRERED